MSETAKRFITTFPQKWALVGMFVSTLLLSISIEVLGRMPTTPTIEWDAGLLIACNFLLITTALAFVWLAAKTAIQHLMFSVMMLGTLISLLYLYSLVV
jgi:uncharacterized metal-binding protein